VPDAIVLSDLHLGSDVCQAKAITRLLEQIRQGELFVGQLILNGDVFDSIDFRRLRKAHWKVLSLLRKLSDHFEIVWINGNHDGPAEIVSHLLGVTVRDELILESGGRRVLILHGHQFDDFIERYPIITRLADLGYRLLQVLDKSHTFAKVAKKSSKTFLRCVKKVETMAIEYAAKLGCDAVCCGHTHLPTANTAGPVHYFNSGCWTERPCHYLVVDNGQIELRTVEVEVEVEEPAESQVA
jgi:UDP-2,3-diacylglucosamine pyrophosphatase LpxH